MPSEIIEIWNIAKEIIKDIIVPLRRWKTLLMFMK